MRRFLKIYRYISGIKFYLILESIRSPLLRGVILKIIHSRLIILRFWWRNFNDPILFFCIKHCETVEIFEENMKPRTKIITLVWFTGVSTYNQPLACSVRAPKSRTLIEFNSQKFSLAKKLKVLHFVNLMQAIIQASIGVDLNDPNRAPTSRLCWLCSVNCASNFPHFGSLKISARESLCALTMIARYRVKLKKWFHTSHTNLIIFLCNISIHCLGNTIVTVSSTC